MNRSGRTNITLDPETAGAVRHLLDKIEAEQGFRPTAHQLVSGLIRKAGEA